MMSKAARTLDASENNETNNMSTYRPQDMDGQLAVIDGSPAGYLAYNPFESESEGELLALRHIFLLPEYRGENLGVEMLNYWVENIAKEVNEKFAVEQPNGKMTNILLSEDYAERKENKIRGKDCVFL